MYKRSLGSSITLSIKRSWNQNHLRTIDLNSSHPILFIHASRHVCINRNLKKMRNSISVALTSFCTHEPDHWAQIISIRLNDYSPKSYFSRKPGVQEYKGEHHGQSSTRQSFQSLAWWFHRDLHLQDGARPSRQTQQLWGKRQLAGKWVPRPESDVYPSDGNAPRTCGPKLFAGPLVLKGTRFRTSAACMQRASRCQPASALCPVSCPHQAVKPGQEGLPTPKLVVSLSWGLAAAVLGSRPADSQSLSKALDAAKPADGCLLGAPCLRADEFLMEIC